MRRVHGLPVRGVDVDAETRCAHYDGDRDVVALKFACCESYHPCFRCHESVADHEAEPWPRVRFDEPAVLCGVCGTELTPPAYLDAEHRCPACDAPFNPGCEAHADRYFER
ncbi:CHY zinc finger protein [Halovivax sp.]|uniref:CHY zinc finger protein n=1 Tax=Halovivax sp. TaxID=1935978 RepID=UPI0025B89FB5|nr:CHY zinc finger protein [Halovivax sp.]